MPNPKAQSEVIARALKKGCIDPKSISYIEAHGTGTALGDPIEITGLTKAFSGAERDKKTCAIGSVKSNIGHLEAAAGIAGITKVILQMKHKTIVPSLTHSAELNENIPFQKHLFMYRTEPKNGSHPFPGVPESVLSGQEELMPMLF
ncbi:polyketide synthase [Bacillus velezensis]